MASDRFCIPLGPLDHIVPHNIPQSAMYLSLKQDIKAVDAFDRLQEGLRRTLLQVPWLCGTVHRQSAKTPGWRPGQLEIRWDKQYTTPDLMRFNELDISKSYADLQDAGFPLDVFDDDVIWTMPWNPDFDNGAPVFAVQANFLPGGCILTFSFSSVVSDGTAMLMVIKLWADHCSSLMRTPDIRTVKMLPSENYDRSILNKYHEVQWRATRTTGTSMGILSPMVLPFNDTCFGGEVFGNSGKPDAFRPIMGACNRGFRTSFVIPRKKHGGLEFVMTLSDEEMDFLCKDEEFSRYAFPLN